MTTVDPRPGRRGRAGEAWHRFRRWRRNRPFWGGLLTALAGVEIFGTTQMSLGGLSFQMGPTGFLSWLIPTILVACGMLMWFSPQQRIFYAVVAVVTALFSLIGVNLGGFLVGLLLGMVGSGLGFAWVPDDRPAADQPGRGGAAAPPDLASEDAESSDIAVQPPASGHRTNRLFAVALPLVALTVVVATAGSLPVRATPAVGVPAGPSGPSCPTRSPSASANPDSTAEPSGPAPGSPSASPSAGDEPGDPGRDGGIATDLLDGIGRLVGGGDADDEPEATPTPSETATPAPEGTATPAPEGTATPGPGGTATPAPSPTGGRPAPPSRPCPAPNPDDETPTEHGQPLPRIAAEPGQPLVAVTPSKLTGSKVTMTALRFDGIVDLPTSEGTLRTLKFRMEHAVTDDFLLRSPGPSGQTLRFVTDRLTVRGDVSFYATRFVGRLLGIKITLTPDLPLPDGIPITSPIPITFTEPVMDLAFVTSDTLTARPTLRVDLA
ncbi:hypothetical protein Vqi01_55580 [Micromonospora qiuiae]|uniref:Uncharacterized protein n=1 Tax=Micromonospora qiuiae TaxID=502268 RepID=A0ABQ4JIY7_9ACTN|nr:DUF6114 domain-containing protein [Micromonospora qiuiae]GIJ30396.1 hypothetical protein Vqi01_55580 [Micromonospora qiuiae]